MQVHLFKENGIWILKDYELMWPEDYRQYTKLAKHSFIDPLEFSSLKIYFKNILKKEG